MELKSRDETYDINMFLNKYTIVIENEKLTSDFFKRTHLRYHVYYGYING